MVFYSKIFSVFLLLSCNTIMKFRKQHYHYCYYFIYIYIHIRNLSVVWSRITHCAVVTTVWFLNLEFFISFSFSSIKLTFWKSTYRSAVLYSSIHFELDISFHLCSFLKRLWCGTLEIHRFVSWEPCLVEQSL